MAFAAFGSGIEKIRGCRVGVQTKTLVVMGRHMSQRFVLHDKIAQAVKDRFALINFHSHKHVRPMGGEQIRAGIDAGVGELCDEVGLMLDLRQSLGVEPASSQSILVMQADQHEIGLTARFPDLTQVLLDVSRRAFSRDVEFVGQAKMIAAKINFGRYDGAELGCRVKAALDYSTSLFVESQRLGNPHEGGQTLRHQG